MIDQSFQPAKELTLKRTMRPWKWAGLAVFVAALLLGRWMPSVVVAVSYVAGMTVLANLAFHVLRYLKNRIFWRVRYRIVGSFIFVGLLPLLLIAGIVYCSAYLLFGQLSANYLDASLHDIERQVTEMNLELADLLRSPAGPSQFVPVVERFHRNIYAAFPRLSATLLRRNADGTFAIVSRYDPQAVLLDLEVCPAEKWLDGKTSFEGLQRRGKNGLITSLRLVPALPDHCLTMSVPIDSNLELRLRKDKEIYVAITEFGDASVEKKSGGVQVKFGSEKNGDGGREFGDDLSTFSQVSAADDRRMITWGALLRCQDFNSGKRNSAAFALFRIPLSTLYRVYLSGSYDIGAVVLKAIIVLVGIFVVAEITSLFIGATISRRITRSVHDMYVGILALQKGELQHKIPVRRSDQLGLLAHSFNQMTASIVRLLEEVSEKKRLEQELEIAREVQATLFPKQLPHPRGLSLFGGCEPARVVSGDYYDFIHEDDARLHIIVGDISGKGISAALLMANLQAAMRNQISTFRSSDKSGVEQSLAEVMKQLNSQIFLNSPSEKYATLFAGRYDAETRRLCYCNAGHLPPIVIHNGDCSRLEAGGTVLGLFESASYQASSIDLVPQSVIVLFTDGITEAVNDKDEEFGEARLMEALLETRSNDPEAIYRHVTAKVRLWQGTLKQHDDITLIVAKVE